MLVPVKDVVRLMRRIAVTVAGTVILAVGVVLLVAPGPGLVVIAVALAVFAIEYEWARRRLAGVRARAQSAAIKTAGSQVATASAVLFGIGAIGVGMALIFVDELPLSGAGTGAGAAVTGLTVLVTVVYGVRELRRVQQAATDDDDHQAPGLGTRVRFSQGGSGPEPKVPDPSRPKYLQHVRSRCLP